MKKVLLLVILVGSGLCGCNQAATESGAGASGAPAAQVVTTAGGEEMVLVPGGTFTMGSDSGEPNERPARQVTLSPFLIDRREVSQALWMRHMDSNMSRFKGDDNLPADQVAWAAAAFFCNARSRAEGLEPVYDEDTGKANFEANGYRLPTEAEWEYTARAGTSGEWFFGADERQLRNYAWYRDNSQARTHPVGQLRPNPWGIYDIYGNVAEWCNDVYLDDAYQSAAAENPRGPDLEDDGSLKYVLRGGAYNSSASATRSAARVGEFPGQFDGCIGGDYLGFRCVRSAPAEPFAEQEM